MSIRRRTHIAAALAAAVSLSGLALASDAQARGFVIAAQSKFPSSWKQKQNAKAAYKKGKAAMTKGDFATALQGFQMADSLHPGAAPKYQIAVCYDKLGQAPEAVAAYRVFIDSKPSGKYADRVVAAGKRIAELEATMVTKVTLQITPANLAGLAVTVDNRPIQGSEVELKAGEHTVVITAPNHLPVTQTITVRQGEPMTLPINLQPQGPPPSIAPAENETEDPGMGLKIAGFTLVGVGGAGLVAMGIFGGMALGSASDFDADPTTEGADDAESQAMIADIFLGVGGGLLIAGGVLLYLGYSADEDDGDFASAVPTLVPWAGPEGAGTMATWSF